MQTEQPYHYNFQDIQRYLNDGMTMQEMHALERAALNDPLLADAIDGYSGADNAIATQHLNVINALLHRSETLVAPMPARKRNNWWRWAAAAGIAGLLGMSAWLLTKQDNTTGKLSKADEVVMADSAVVKAPATEKTAKTDDTILANINTNVPDRSETDHLATNTEKKDIPAGSKPAAAEMREIPGIAHNETILEQQQSNAIVEAAPENATNALKQANVLSRTNPAIPSAPTAKIQSPNVFTGLITDENGNPLPGATVTAGNISTVSNPSGRFNFTMPGLNDSLNIYVSAAGYKNEKTVIEAGKITGIELKPDNMRLDDVVVVGFGNRKKKATLGSIRELKVDTLKSSAYPYPEGGWLEFYDDLAMELGVNKDNAKKSLHIRFWIEEGTPTNFTVIKTPDMAIANKAIAAIKKGPKWKNFRDRSMAEVKMKVN